MTSSKSINSFSITLLVTEQCNLRCNYCYEHFLYRAPTSDQFQKIANLLKNISKSYSSINVSFFGGEPLLAFPTIKKFIGECDNLDSDFTYAMTTNGVFLTPEKLDFLVKKGLKQFQVTFDGAKNSHDQIRIRKPGEQTFDRIYQNLLSARKLNGEFEALIRVNASPKNSSEIGDLADLLSYDFASDGRFFAFIRPVGKWGGPNDDNLSVLSSDDYSQLEKEFYSRIPPSMRSASTRNHVCYAALPNHLLIYPDGTLGKCTVGIHDEVNKIGHISLAGKIIADPKKVGFWSRGFATGDAAQLACPYKAS